MSAGKREHGTRAKYTIESCRCEPCTIANRVYARNLAREHAARAYGLDVEPRLIDPTPSRERLLLLRRNGIGLRTVEKLTGLDREGTLQQIISGETKRVRPDTYDLIMSITYDDRPGGTLIPAGPTWQLLNKLIKAGHTRTAIATAIAGKPTCSLQIQRKRVRLDTARKVEQAYRELMGDRLEAMQTAAQRRAHHRARAKELQR